MYCCLECGKSFRTEAAAQRAVDHGCPKCGSTDVDLDNRPAVTRAKVRELTGRVRQIDQRLADAIAK